MSKQSTYLKSIVDDDSDTISIEHKGKKIRKETKTKRGPGRPRKNPKKQKEERKGIVLQPQHDIHIMEFIYDMPSIFKKIWAFFKSISSSKVQIIFRPTEVILYTKDHLGNSDIRVKIDCSKVNRYYCESEFDIGLTRMDTDSIMSKIDKNYEKIVITSRKNQSKKSLRIVLYNEKDIDESHTTGVINDYDHLLNEHKFLAPYTIQFDLTGRLFKKTMNDINQFNKTATFSRNTPDSPLLLEYHSVNGRVNSSHIFRNPEKIKLKSLMKPGDNFRVTFNVEYIKPISASQVSDVITILLNEDTKMMMVGKIDNGTIEIKVLTKIVEENLNIE